MISYNFEVQYARKILLNTNGNISTGKLSEASAVELLTEYAPLVKSRAMNYLTQGAELDDLIQEGNIGLFSAFFNYRPELSSFTTFARRCVDASIIDYLRKNNKTSRIPEGLIVDIGDAVVVDTSFDPEHSFDIKEEYNKVVDKAKSVLSELEFTVFSDIILGYSNGEIAKRHSLALRSVNNAVSRIRAKLK